MTVLPIIRICLLNSFNVILTFALLSRQFHKQAPSYLKLLVPKLMVLNLGTATGTAAVDS